VRAAGVLLTVAALAAVATPSCGGSGPAGPPCLSADFDAGGDPYCEALLQTVRSCFPSDGCWADAVRQCALAAPSANRPWDTAAAGALSCDVLTHGPAPGNDGGAVTTTPALDKLAHDYCAVCNDSNCPDSLFGPYGPLSILASANDALVADVEKECIVPLGTKPTPDACQNFQSCAFDPTQLDAFYNGPRNACGSNTAHAGCDAPQQQPAAWAVRFGDDHLQDADAMAVDATGNIAITGQMAGTLDFGMGPIMMASAPLDRFLARVSPSGQPQWSKSIGSQVGPFEVSFVAAAGDGSIVVAGSNDPTSATPWSDIASFDATGALRWHKNWMDPSWVGGAGEPLLIQGLGADGAGGSVVGGWYGGTFDFGTGPQASTGVTDGVLVSFDPAGAARWVRHFGNPGSATFIDDIAVDPTGNTFVAGAFEGTIDLGTGPLVDPDPPPGPGSYIFIAALDPTGKALWARSFGGARQKAGTIVATADHGVVIGGWVHGSLDLDGHSITSGSNPEMYVARFDPTGHVTWVRPVGVTSGLESPLLALDSHGDILLTGICENSLDIIGSIPCGAPDDTFAAKLDADGNATWTTLHRHARWSGVGADPSGHLILGGSLAGAVDIGGTSLQTAAGSWDVALAALLP
jgi:hypothetical protein